MLERLQLGNFERALFITFFALAIAVINLGVKLRATPEGSSGSEGSYVSYESPITDNLFTVQEIQPLELITAPDAAPLPTQTPRSVSAPQPPTAPTTSTQPTTKTLAPRQTTSPTQTQNTQTQTDSGSFLGNLLNKLL